MATAVVDSPPSTPVQVPSAAFSAVKSGSRHTEAVLYRLREVHGHPLPQGGRATVNTGTTTLADRLVDTYLLPPLRLLTGLE
ncbi:hypothetical protein ACIBCO_39720 [Streptomyces violascens]|uniref:hypothetical protein n=1 Tax=Streptomyces violascens TaxID=67381 RepID=UPI0037B0E326